MISRWRARSGSSERREWRRGGFAARQEDEQLVAGVDEDGVSKMAPFGVGRLELEQTVEFARECARIRLDGGIGEIAPPAADVAGALQERLERRGEHGAAGVDGVLRISDQMGEAELVRLGVIALREEAVGEPYLGSRAVEELGR